MFIRGPFNYDRKEVRMRTALTCGKEGGAKQEFKEECDINTILRRFNVTGQLPSGVRVPSYGDFEYADDFHSAVNAVALAHESFDAMPADVRRRFKNDPGEFVDFCSKSENLEEMRKLGLAVPLPPEPAKPAAGEAATVSSSPEGSAIKGASAPVVAPLGASGTLPT